MTSLGALWCCPYSAGGPALQLEDRHLQVTVGSETACPLFWVDSGSATKGTLIGEKRNPQEGPWRHAAGQLAQMELQAGPCACSHLGFDDLPPFITGPLDLKVPILCCLSLLLEECELSEHFLKAVLNCILLLLNIKLL